MDIDVGSLERQTGLTGLSGYEAKYLAKALSLGVLDVAVSDVRRHREQREVERQRKELFVRMQYFIDARRKLKSAFRAK